MTEPRDARTTLELLEAAAAGRQDARDALCVRYLDDLRAYVRTHMPQSLRAKESQSDVSQMVLLEVLGEIEQFEYRGEGSLRAWLFDIASKRIKDRLRYWTAQRRDLNAEVVYDERLRDSYTSFLSPESVAERNELIGVVEQAIHALPEERREILTLRIFARLSHKEIAERLGKSHDSIRQVFARTMADLTRQLDDAS